MLRPEDIFNQVDFKEGKIISKTSGTIWEFDDFVKSMSSANKWSSKQQKQFVSMFNNYIIPQTEKSIQVEKLIDKYGIKFSDGVYIVQNDLMDIDTLYKFFWNKERILPTEANSIIECIEKISERFEIQSSIYNKFITREKTDKKSKYLESLDKLYPNNNFRNIIYNVLVPKSEPLFHIFYDDGFGGTGKSTFLDIITKIIGSAYISNVTLNNFANRFMFANMFGKYANIADDNGKCDEIQNVEILKSIVTGGRVTIDRKNISPIEVVIFAKQLFATNYLPFIDFTDGGIMRRLNIVTMNKQIPPDWEMVEIDEEEISAIISEALCAGDIKKGKNNNELAVTTNPIYRFFKDYHYKEKDYDSYCTFCNSNGFRRMNIINFEIKMRFITQFEENEKIKNNKHAFKIKHKISSYATFDDLIEENAVYDPKNMLYKLGDKKYKKIGERFFEVSDEELPF